MTQWKAARLVVAALVGVGLVAVAASAQDYPQRPIEMVVTFGPGGGADLMGRQMGRLMEKPLGVSIPISNVAGASGNAGLTRLRPTHRMDTRSAR